MFRFANSNLLILLILCIIFVIFMIMYIKQRKKRIRKFGDWKLIKELTPQYSKSLPTYKALLLIIALVFIVFALARPQFGESKKITKNSGIEIMIALDISTSMLAEDITPNRLERAKYAISQLINKLKNNKIGLVVFAGDAFVQLPMTTDYSAAKLFVSTISTDLISMQGTSIGSAINLAIPSFSSDSEIGKAIIIITDGEEHEGNAITAAKSAKAEGINIFTIGIGLSKGAPIPIAEKQGKFLKDEKGNTVISKLNSEFLKKIASNANGVYIQASNTNVGLGDIFNEVQRMNTEEFQDEEFVAHEEQFKYFIWVAILLIIFGILLPERKHKSWEKYNIFNLKQNTSIRQ